MDKPARAVPLVRIKPLSSRYQAALGAILALFLALAFTFCFAVALACVVFAAGFAIGAAAGALVWAAAGVEITAKGMASTAALARMDRNFFMGTPGV